MNHWKKEYEYEALAIAAAERRRRAGNRIETRIVIRALMVARGDIELKKPNY
jgi:hypothetical protein